jgi:hypothetical protein
MEGILHKTRIMGRWRAALGCKLSRSSTKVKCLVVRFISCTRMNSVFFPSIQIKLMDTQKKPSVYLELQKYSLAELLCKSDANGMCKKTFIFCNGIYFVFVSEITQMSTVGVDL